MEKYELGVKLIEFIFDILYVIKSFGKLTKEKKWGQLWEYMKIS